MSCLFVSLFLISSISSNLKVVSPPELAEKFNYKDNKGSLEYSVSTFGEILYN